MKLKLSLMVAWPASLPWTVGNPYFVAINLVDPLLGLFMQLDTIAAKISKYLVKQLPEVLLLKRGEWVWFMLGQVCHPTERK